MMIDDRGQASPDIFSPYECLGLWVGAICHDLDHRGFNNKFMIDSKSALAAIYSTSTMENHHFNMGVSILQQVECSPENTYQRRNKIFFPRNRTTSSQPSTLRSTKKSFRP